MPNMRSTLFSRSLFLKRRARIAKSLYTRDHFLFQEACQDILERLFVLPLVELQNRRWLELGCGVHSLSRAFEPLDFFVPTDPSPSVVATFKRRAHVIDEENLPFQASSFDLVTSVLFFHWIENWPAVLTNIKNVLKPGGYVAVNFFSTQTLKEMRDVLLKAQMQEEGGISPHISLFVRAQDVVALLKRAGFHNVVVDSQIFKLSYKGLRDVMYDVRHLGETNALMAQKKTFMPRKTFLRAESLYRELYPDSQGGVGATFEVCTFVAHT